MAWAGLRDLSWLRPLLAVPHRLLLLAIAAFLLAINWGVYIYAVSVDNVVESSLGCFINPLVLVLMGVLILHERLRPLQWTAVAVGTLAVLVIAWDYGRPPWIALALAFSFAAYGFIKMKVGPIVGALPSMTVESAVLVLGEQVLSVRWVGFGLVWVALVILTADSLWGTRRRTRLQASPVAGGS